MIQTCQHTKNYGLAGVFFCKRYIINIVCVAKKFFFGIYSYLSTTFFAKESFGEELRFHCSTAETGVNFGWSKF